ncbi:hypothetical protein HELRODRAFT_176122 [Helobdella robusta]|uniref:Uncharacterized protein n=1 Tax=Helobdella robusta TaxID=6412 RepID=T1FA61_HELRO|nr:hypothetical protein HELRODRAFT_176122 [Helobdella robusta]ESO00264.1 hypothetical protein HELRODRAFT_176122 [Helobdella robusta]
MTNNIRFPSGFLKAADVNPSTLEHFCDFYAAAIISGGPNLLLKSTQGSVDAVLCHAHTLIISSPVNVPANHTSLITYWQDNSEDFTLLSKKIGVTCTSSPSVPTWPNIAAKCIGVNPLKSFSSKEISF